MQLGEMRSKQVTVGYIVPAKKHCAALSRGTLPALKTILLQHDLSLSAGMKAMLVGGLQSACIVQRLSATPGVKGSAKVQKPHVLTQTDKPLPPWGQMEPFSMSQCIIAALWS